MEPRPVCRIAVVCKRHGCGAAVVQDLPTVKVNDTLFRKHDRSYFLHTAVVGHRKDCLLDFRDSLVLLEFGAEASLA